MGSDRRGPLRVLMGSTFEDGLLVRSFPSYKGQRGFPGLWWSATSGRHVGYESWLERDEAMLLDFDQQVVVFASQPLWLLWHDGQQVRSHAPDSFARLADGTGVVIDCRPADRVRPRDAAAFAATGQACGTVGWQYRLVHEHDPVLVANVRWLAAYRHPRHDDTAIAATLLAVFELPRALLAGAKAVGDPIAVLPVLYHLLWTGRLVVDLSAPLWMPASTSGTACFGPSCGTPASGSGRRSGCGTRTSPSRSGS